MMKRRLFLLPIFLLALVGCNGKALETPTLVVNEEKTGLTWAPVANASGYEIKVNDGKAKSVSTNNIGYLFSEDVGTFKVQVVAKGGNGYANSKPAIYDYKTVETDLGNLRSDNGSITWGIFKGGSLKIRDVTQETWTEIDPAIGSYTPTSGCVFELYAGPGFNEADKANYIENPEAIAKKTVAASPRATTNLVFEDGSAPTNSDLADKYKALNGNNNWQECGATVTLSQMNVGYTEGKCIQLQFWHHGWWYRYDSDIEMDKAYDTLSFAIKGSPEIEFTISLVIGRSFIVNTPLGEFDLAGARLSYALTFENSNWTQYNISMSDSKWVIKDTDLGDISINSVIGFLDSYGFTLNSVADLCPLFTSLQYRVKAAGDSNGSNAYVYLDDVGMSYTGQKSSVEELLAIQESYAFRSNSSNGTIVFNNDRSQATIKYVENEQQVSVPANATTENGELHLVAENNALDMYLTTQDGGFNFSVKSVTGTLASMFNGAQISVFTMLDDFESYTETGKGYDYNNSKDSRSGMRANYYFDYYGGGSDSPVGGNGWNLMQSTNYFDLETSGGLYNSQCAKVKFNRGAAMRYMNYGLYDGTATPITKGGKLVFFAKGSDTETINIKIRVYKVNQVTQNNQITGGSVSTLFDNYPIYQNSGEHAGWQKYELTLEEGATYYGFSITTISVGGSGATYFYLDNIYVYSAVNPF